MNSNKKKVLVLGIDSGTWDVFLPFVEKGIMPRLKKLIDSSCSGVLKSTNPPMTPPGWTTLMTGVHPGKHGIYGFEDFNSETGTLGHANSNTIAVETMWSYLSSKGQKVASLNMPMTYPPYEVDGVMVSGFGSPGNNSNFTWPQNFKDKIFDAIPNYDISLGWSGAETIRNTEDLKRSVDEVNQRFMQDRKLFRLTCDTVDWNLLLIQIFSFDAFLHKGWKYVTPEYCQNNPKNAKIVDTMFAAADELIGELADYCNSPDHLFTIVSDHGHGKSGKYEFQPNLLLKKMGYLKTKRSISRMLIKLKRSVRKRVTGVKQRMSLHISQKLKIDIKKTKAFSPYARHQAGIFINLEDRSPEGIVPKNEYNTMVNELRNTISETKHPTTGEKIVDKILTPQELYQSNDIDNSILGDLIIIPKQYCELSKSTKGDNFITKNELHDIKGTHRPEGMYLIRGINISEGKTLKADIADIVPTIYAHLGVEIPLGLDGKVISDAFESKPEIIYSDEPISGVDPDNFLMSEKEMDILEDQLKNMGYI